MKKWTLLFLIIFLLFLPLASAVNYPQLRGFVTDNANMIDPAYEEKITQLAQKIEKESTVEIAAVTIESLEGESKEMYAVNLFKQAGIGKKDKDNGLLILVAKKEREYRFEVGYGLEGTITDSMKVNIGDRIIVPNFRNGEYGKGIYESMLIIQGLLQGNEEVKSKYSMRQDAGNWIIDFFVSNFFLESILILFIGFILFKIYKDKNKKRAWGLMLCSDVIVLIVAYIIYPVMVVLIIIFFSLIPFGVFVKKYEKQAWISLLGIDAILLLVTSFKSDGLFDLTTSLLFFQILFLANFIYRFRTGKGGGWSSGDRDWSGGGGFGGGFSGGRSGGGGGGFGGGRSGGGGFGGKW